MKARIRMESSGAEDYFLQYIEARLKDGRIITLSWDETFYDPGREQDNEYVIEDTGDLPELEGFEGAEAAYASVWSEEPSGTVTVRSITLYDGTGTVNVKAGIKAAWED